MAIKVVVLTPFEPLFPVKQNDIDYNPVKYITPLKKMLKKTDFDAVIYEIVNINWQKEMEELISFVRTGMANDWLPIIIVNRLDTLLNEATVMSDFDIFALYNSQEQEPEEIQTIIEQRLKPFTSFKQQLGFSRKQTQLLTTVNQFSHYRQPLAELVNDFALALHNYTYANLSLKIFMKGEQISKIEGMVDEAHYTDESICLLSSSLESQVRRAVIQKNPQVELAVPKELSDAIVGLGKKKPSCLITFPIVVYSHVICVVMCFIPFEQMRYLSVSSINIMKESAQHLKMLLERRSAENRLKAQYQRLKASLTELQTTKDQAIHEEKLTSIGEFAAGIAHEVNNPLAYVLANFSPLDDYVETLLNTLKIHDEIIDQIEEKTRPQISEYRQALKLLHEETEMEHIVEDIQAIVNDSRDGLLRVRDIISDLSSFGRKQALETSQFNVRKLVEETLRILSYEVKNKIVVKVSVDHEVMLNSHRGFLQQILTNLIKNACQAIASTRSQKAPPEIEISHEIVSNQFCLKVRDNGPGIAPSNLNKIFDPFFTTKDVGKGTGLGLSVTYSLAKKMGGDLKVSSELNKYTCFIISLPK